MDGEVAERDRKAIAVIAGAGVFAIGLAFIAWWILSSQPSVGKAATAMSTARVSVNAVPGPGATAADTEASETFAVPTPSFVTQPLSISLGAREVEIPGETPWTSPSASTSASPAPRPSSSSSSSASTIVRGLSLSCSNQGGRRIRAVLTFFATGPVPVSLTAGDRTTSLTTSGNARIDLLGNAPSGVRGTCRAEVNGTTIGPIPAR